MIVNYDYCLVMIREDLILETTLMIKLPVNNFFIYILFRYLLNLKDFIFFRLIQMIPLIFYSFDIL